MSRREDEHATEDERPMVMTLQHGGDLCGGDRQEKWSLEGGLHICRRGSREMLAGLGLRKEEEGETKTIAIR